MNIKVNISITNDKGESFMGIGIVWLIRGIKKHGSIYGAAKEMGLSYMKAMRMLKHLEKNLGENVITRKHGGNERCGAEITPFGEKFINSYEVFQKKIKKNAVKEFKKFIKSM